MHNTSFLLQGVSQAIKTKHKTFDKCSVGCWVQSRCSKPASSAGCRSRPLGGINIWMTSDSALIQSSLPPEGELRDYALIFGIRKWIYLQSHGLTWTQQRSTDVTTIVRSFPAVMLTADWSWKSNVLQFMSWTLQRGEGKRTEKT